jgi:hypothetical protein
VETRTTGGVLATNAYRDGVEEGRRVTIRPPVGAAASAGGLLTGRGGGRDS